MTFFSARRLAVALPFWLLVVGLAGHASAAWPPVFRSVIGQFTLLRPRDPPPAAPLAAPDGTPVDLRRYRGKVVVLNVWASWCAPCLAEMPALERLREASDPRRVAVVTVSIDADRAAAAAYVAAHRLTGLTVLLDPGKRFVSENPERIAAGALPLRGLPITYIIGKSGRVEGYLVGAAQWDSPEARRLLDFFLHQPEETR